MIYLIIVFNCLIILIYWLINYLLAISAWYTFPQFIWIIVNVWLELWSIILVLMNGLQSWPFMFNKSGNGPTNSSSDSGSDSPMSSVDNFNLHDCLTGEEHQPQNQRQLPHYHCNSRSEISIMNANYQIHEQQQQGVDYSTIPSGLNYCGNLAELQ